MDRSSKILQTLINYIDELIEQNTPVMDEWSEGFVDALKNIKQKLQEYK